MLFFYACFSFENKNEERFDFRKFILIVQNKNTKPCDTLNMKKI
jgi:hypothetical protein